MNEYYIVYKKKILHGPMSKEGAIKKLFEMSSTLKGLRVRSFYGKKDIPSTEETTEEQEISPASFAENDNQGMP
ncbi:MULTISPECIES: hypothetical protein [unclassified Paenibacillus]|uniref:hypothetical protein n=1 Tax=unclassified Paenibacillus TaxID=185978 RepID=UPI00363B9567